VPCSFEVWKHPHAHTHTRTHTHAHTHTHTRSHPRSYTLSPALSDSLSNTHTCIRTLPHSLLLSVSLSRTQNPPRMPSNICIHISERNCLPPSASPPLPHIDVWIRRYDRRRGACISFRIELRPWSQGPMWSEQSSSDSRICAPPSYVCLLHMCASFICVPPSYVCLLHMCASFICVPPSYVCRRIWRPHLIYLTLLDVSICTLSVLFPPVECFWCSLDVVDVVWMFFM